MRSSTQEFTILFVYTVVGHSSPPHHSPVSFLLSAHCLLILQSFSKSTFYPHFLLLLLISFSHVMASSFIFNYMNHHINFGSIKPFSDDESV